jgi:carboxyl-terminal processing protease
MAYGTQNEGLRMIRNILIKAGLAATCALAPFATLAADKSGNSPETYRLLSLFGDVFERVRNDYVEPVGDEQLIEAALNGMLTSLDPHSNYMNPKNFKDMQVQIQGEYGGLGLEVTMEQGFVKVVSPIDDTPAARAGIRPNDLITNLDGETVQGMTLNDAVERMRGPVNTDIRVTFRREGQAPFDVTLTRTVVKIQTVRSKLVDNVGYIRVSQFVASTEAGLRKNIEQLKKEANGHLQGIVLDLRNDPGGLLDQAVAVTSDFLDKGEVVSTRSRHAEETQRYDARGKDLTDGLPMVVLINDGSASASEIVAGALQDHRRAILLGTKSFGKGSVQTIIPFGRDGAYGAIRLTTARYYTPSGRSIQALGIEPDIKVGQAKVEQVDPPAGQVRSEAALKGALRNDTLKDGGKGKAKDGKDGAKPDDGKAAPAKDDKIAADEKAAGDAPLDPLALFGNPARDYQLSRAIDLLHGLSLYKGVAKN